MHFMTQVSLWLIFFIALLALIKFVRRYLPEEKKPKKKKQQGKKK